MLYSDRTSRDDTKFENIMGAVTALSVLCLMAMLLFI